MSNSVNSIQVSNQQSQLDQAVQPVKTEQKKAQNAPPQDSVTISDSAKQAQNGQPASGTDANHDGH